MYLIKLPAVKNLYVNIIFSSFDLLYGKDHTSTSVVTEVSATVVSPSENSFSSTLSSCSQSTSGQHNTHKHNDSYNRRTQQDRTAAGQDNTEPVCRCRWRCPGNRQMGQ